MRYQAGRSSRAGLGADTGPPLQPALRILVPKAPWSAVSVSRRTATAFRLASNAAASPPQSKALRAFSSFPVARQPRGMGRWFGSSDRAAVDANRLIYAVYRESSKHAASRAGWSSRRAARRLELLRYGLPATRSLIEDGTAPSGVILGRNIADPRSLPSDRNPILFSLMLRRATSF